MNTREADSYRTTHMKEFNHCHVRGYTVIPVLEFLNGKPWCSMALNYVEALRPHYIRVTAGEQTCDAVTWRVTVHLEKDNRTIRFIEQEVEVGLRDKPLMHCGGTYLNKWLKEQS